MRLTLVRPEDGPAAPVVQTPLARAAPPPLEPATHGSATSGAAAGGAAASGAAVPDLAEPPPVSGRPAPTMSRLSYSALGEYARCGYRFYAERVLGLPPVALATTAGPGTGDGLSGTERGSLVHTALERLDFRRPTPPPPVGAVLAAGMRVPAPDEAAELDALIAAFAESDLCARLGRADEVRREERFALRLGDVLMTGAFDVVARERGAGMLVVDYKTDRLLGTDPGARVAASYATQRLVYALAALRAGAPEVEVAHVYLEAAGDPVMVSFTAADRERLEQELTALSAGVLDSVFEVTDVPQRTICAGCPAEGGLCSWPREMTRREAADRLF